MLCATCRLVICNKAFLKLGTPIHKVFTINNGFKNIILGHSSPISGGWQGQPVPSSGEGRRVLHAGQPGRFFRQRAQLVRKVEVILDLVSSQLTFKMNSTQTKIYLYRRLNDK